MVASHREKPVASAPFHDDAFCDLVADIGTPRFDDRLLRVVDDRMPIQQVSVFELSSRNTADLIACSAKGSGGKAQTFQRSLDYIGGSFLDDPIPAKLRSTGLSNGSVRVTREDLPRSAFRTHFYDGPGICEDTIFWRASIEGLLMLTFHRSDQYGPLSRHEFGMLQDQAALLLSATFAHARSVRAAYGTVPLSQPSLFRTRRPDGTDVAAVQAGLIADPAALSEREALVCAYLVFGFTALGIGAELGISTNTVSTHRKRSYAKLGVCSHADLVTYSLRTGLVSV